MSYYVKISFDGKVVLIMINENRQTINDSYKQNCPILVDINHSTCEKGYLFGAHYHSNVEFLYGLKGSLFIKCKNEEYHLKEGDLILINPDIVHYTIGEDEENQYICMRMLPMEIYNASKNIVNKNHFLPFIITSDDYPIFFKSEYLLGSYVPQVLKDMLYEYENQNTGYEMSLISGVYKLLVWILRYWEENAYVNKISMENADFEIYHKIRGFIGKNFYKDISVNDVAKYCNMSYSSFYKRFKEIMGYTFTDYITNVRISEAEKLLATTSIPINDISQKVGFSTPSYFVSQFKKSKNVTPKHYRKEFLNE
ncbi:MAG: AraC family transcriptional regulator [Ruminococcaceae bacterium]|nr:AraC family transcriptional regulator [Oscillospiraceae bacterium]